MSRIGKNPVSIPSDVTVQINNGVINVKGPKGELSYETRPEIDVKVVEDKVVAEVKIDTKQSNALWGLTQSLVKNMIEGVTKGYEKKLELVGVGYRVKSVNPTEVSITVGYSHPVEFKAPEGVTLDVEGTTELTVKGIDKHLVGQTAANIRKIRKPEPYKGKGIKYADEVVRRKPGKTGKV